MPLERTRNVSETMCGRTKPGRSGGPAPQGLVGRLLGLLRAEGLPAALALRPLEAGRWRGEAEGLDIYATEDGESLLLARRRAGALEVSALGDMGEAAARNLADCLVRGLANGTVRFVLDLGRAGRVGHETEAVVQSLRRCLGREAAGGEVEVRRREDPCWRG